MPAFGIGTLLYLLGQGVIASFFSREIRRYSRWSPLVAAIGSVLLGIALVVVVRNILWVLLLQLLVLALCLLMVRRSAGRPSPR